MAISQIDKSRLQTRVVAVAKSFAKNENTKLQFFVYRQLGWSSTFQFFLHQGANVKIIDKFNQQFKFSFFQIDGHRFTK